MSAHNILVEVTHLVVSHFLGESHRVKGNDLENCHRGICFLPLGTVCEPFGCLGYQHESSRVLQECHGRTVLGYSIGVLVCVGGEESDREIEQMK